MVEKGSLNVCLGYVLRYTRRNRSIEEIKYADSDVISEVIWEPGNRITSATWLECLVVFNLFELNVKRTPRELNRRQRKRTNETRLCRSRWPRSSRMPAAMYVPTYVCTTCWLKGKERKENCLSEKGRTKNPWIVFEQIFKDVEVPTSRLMRTLYV